MAEVAVFLDVDGVVTDRPINLQIAEMLGCHAELYQLEEAFRNRTITSSMFGARLSALFKSKRFGQDFVREHYDQFEIRDNLEDLVVPDWDLFLVSTGPSYFIDELVRRYGIRKDRVLCSRYQFGGDGFLERCARAVTDQDKKRFVEMHASRYLFTIGVGDDERLDAPFLALCSAQVLVSKNTQRGYLASSELGVVRELAARATKALRFTNAVPGQVLQRIEAARARTGTRRRVFIVTPFKQDAGYQAVVETIRNEVQRDGGLAYTANDEQLSPNLWENVQGGLLSADAVAVVLTCTNDRPVRGGNGKSTFNPNVAIELGYALACNKPVLVLKDSLVEDLPVDVRGLLYREFDMKSPAGNVRDAVRDWLQTLSAPA